MKKVSESDKFLNFTATTSQLKDGNLSGIFVSQASGSPTLRVVAGNGTIANTFTPVAGVFYPMPGVYRGGLTVTVGGTVDATIYYSI